MPLFSLQSHYSVFLSCCYDLGEPYFLHEGCQALNPLQPAVPRTLLPPCLAAVEQSYLGGAKRPKLIRDNVQHHIIHQALRDVVLSAELLNCTQSVLSLEMRHTIGFRQEI